MVYGITDQIHFKIKRDDQLIKLEISLSRCLLEPIDEFIKFANHLGLLT